MFIHLLNFGEVYAAEHKLERLHINVFIHKDGSARIIETRKAELTEGTENYIVIGNLGKSEIKDFVVKEDGETYRFVDNWDIDASQEEKAFRNGIIKKRDGYELSWGIGPYGEHEYIVEYTITNFIKQLQDSQILFWRFVNDQTNIPPEEVIIEIETEKPLDAETEKIWGFGYPGIVEFSNGKVIAKSNEPLNKNDYVTILVKFVDGMFTTEDYIDQSFEEIREKAFEGSDYGKEKTSGVNKTMRNIFIAIAVIAYLFIRFYNPSIKITKKRPEKFKRKYRGEYYRDYPYEGNFLDVYYLLYIMGATNFEKLLTAFILKWVKEEKVLIETEKVGFFKKEVPVICFFNKDIDDSTAEGKLYYMMLQAAGTDEILKEYEFTSWAGTNRKKLISWEKNVAKESLEILQDLNYVRLLEKRFLFFKKEKYEPTTDGHEFEVRVHQYVNFLHDFSLIHEHEAINVKIWDEIMIWAALLGKTKEVTKQFKKLYPKYAQESVYSGKTLYLADSFSQSASNARTPGRSGGGGGSSSSGGGGGSYGGGSGGGTR